LGFHVADCSNAVAVSAVFPAVASAAVVAVVVADVAAATMIADHVHRHCCERSY